MPDKFTGLGIAFLYPENWKLEEESNDSVTLETPSGAFLTIARFDQDTSPAAAIDGARGTMEEEYEEIEQEITEKLLAGIALEGLTQRFVYLDLVIVSQLLAFAHPTATYLVQIQGEDREMEQTTPVFDAILTSLCQSLAAPESE
ncbi:hypothetical protein [Aureliella helgolandensis]|uniref:Uncharacterized protein n=1 Tax=Aureliella helgolandensis TaxID=2527968 RepID=A0A518GG34_9BACT|nr:hypothetical protein [Aureliella helgolandensis]QDV27562.1 hypothetical protein Q31a_59510 [Aureliella helgolandensis]